jgi:hypothetical protein
MSTQARCVHDTRDQEETRRRSARNGSTQEPAKSTLLGEEHVHSGGGGSSVGRSGSKSGGGGGGGGGTHGSGVALVGEMPAQVLGQLCGGRKLWWEGSAREEELSRKSSAGVRGWSG